MASFVRQLNMCKWFLHKISSLLVCSLKSMFVFLSLFNSSLQTDGFRKVMHIDAGIVKQERDGPVEFQHPYFKHGQDDLLENIKRKARHLHVEN